MILIHYNSRIKSWRNRKNVQRILKIKCFISKYNFEWINYPLEKDDWKHFEKYNSTIACNVLYAKKEKIYPAYVSKHNSDCEKQVILLVTPNEEGWHYIAVKKLSELLRRIMSKHEGDLSSFVKLMLNCLHLLKTKNEHESNK